jgi:hypothetical protein
MSCCRAVKPTLLRSLVSASREGGYAAEAYMLGNTQALRCWIFTPVWVLPSVCGDPGTDCQMHWYTC